MARKLALLAALCLAVAAPAIAAETVVVRCTPGLTCHPLLDAWVAQSAGVDQSPCAQQPLRNAKERCFVILKDVAK
jgi:hypothetical protein